MTALNITSRVALAILLLVFLIYTASALGVTPARTTIDFSPGYSQDVSVTVVNSEHKDMDVDIFVQGVLNTSVSLPTNKIHFNADEDSKQITYSFHLPETLEPGDNIAEIVLLEMPPQAGASQAFIGATVAVVTQLVVSVPYPGKFAKAAFDVINAEQGGDALFLFPVVSLGLEDLENVYANVNIYDINKKKVGSLETDHVQVPSKKRVDIISKWKADVPLGNYWANATLTYDNGTLLFNKGFAVGTPLLELQQINVSDFTLGQVAKFNMLVENKWSEPITAAYANTKVFGITGNAIDEFKSQTYDIPPLTKSVFVSYWDTAGIKKDTYNATISMIYGSKTADNSVQFVVSDNDIQIIGLGYVIGTARGQSNTLVIILVTVIVVLVLLNIMWFLVFRKKFAKHKR
jgi:hypothetical protein